MKTTTIGIQINEADYDLLQRIAKDEKRRFSDFKQLIFALGLDIFFSDQHIMIERKDSEIPPDELKQIELNDKLRKTPDFWQLTDEERIAKGYKRGIDRWLSNSHRNDDGKEEDQLIKPLAERIRSFAID